MRIVIIGLLLILLTLPALCTTAELVAKVGAHPRVLLTDARVGELQALAKTDSALKGALDALAQRAELYLAKPAVQDSPDWNVWRETVARVYILGFSYRYTGDKRFADALRGVLLTASAFPTWHDENSFLDTAEMTHAVALGYDWLYRDLNDADRATIRGAILTKGLQPGLACYRKEAKASWWTGSNHNWNTVCNGGMITGALAVASDDPATAATVLDFAIASLRHSVPTYDPDGAWMEGPYYWEYATRYLVLSLASLQGTLGTDFGLSDGPGLRNTWRYIHYVTPNSSPLVFAYADSLDNRWSVPAVFWLAKRYDDPLAAESERVYFAKPHPWWPDVTKEVADPRFAVSRVLELVWYLPPPAHAPALRDLPLDTRFKGKVELATLRGSWEKDGLCVFVKAGPNGALANHGHCDAGQFELYGMGTGGFAWTRDTKKGGYPAGFFDNGTADKPGKRWSYPVANAFGHNVPILNGQNQNPFATAPIIAFGSSAARSFAVVDLTPVYTAKAAARGVALLARKAVLVQDEFTLDTPAELRWQMTSEAKVTLVAGGATLDRWGQQMQVTILSPAGAQFDPDEAAKKRLVLKLTNQTGAVRVAVFFSPQWPDGTRVPAPTLTPLAEWKP